jgi:transitional endoplasmic reticulum ATPase
MTVYYDNMQDLLAASSVVMYRKPNVFFLPSLLVASVLFFGASIRNLYIVARSYSRILRDPNFSEVPQSVCFFGSDQNFRDLTRPPSGDQAESQWLVQHRSIAESRAADSHAGTSKKTFASIFGYEGTKAKLREAYQAWNGGLGENGILMYGAPGVGKTAMAEAFAGEFNLNIIKANFGSVASRWTNQSTEQFIDLVNQALAQAPCVLFLDEIETLLPDRGGNAGIISPESEKVVSAWLANCEKLRRGKVFYIGATNYIDKVDAAAKRQGRFDHHMEIPLPDHAARLGLIQMAISDSESQYNAKVALDHGVLDRVALRWGGFNVPRILEATKRSVKLAAEDAGVQKSSAKKYRSVNITLTMMHFFRGLRSVQGNQAGAPESAMSLSEMFIDAPVRDRLTEIAHAFRYIDKVEAMGGEIHTGMAFFGPPGTGKTTVAMALAKESGWTFIKTTGRDLLDSDAIDKIAHKASDLRPSIVFIDEADDILADRATSATKIYTNKLLSTIQGVDSDLMRDVVWIIATNNYDSLDSAARRRFPTVVKMGLPSPETTLQMVTDWANRHSHKIDAPVDVWAAKVSVVLGGLAQSIVTDTLKSALRSAIVRNVNSTEKPALSVEDVAKERR